jgi:hypothetical protein
MMALAVPNAASGAMTVTVNSRAVGRIAPGFLGLSMEMRGVESYTGFNSNQINPVLEQLIRELDPGQNAVLRLGGDTTDWTWYPIRGIRRPLGVRYALNATWFKVVKALARGIDGRVIVGVNLEADNARLAAVEASAIIAGIGRQQLEALELGNEPDLYGRSTWFELGGVHYHGRPSSWDYVQFKADYDRIRGALPAFPLVGPDIGQAQWFHNLDPFLSTEPSIQLATMHLYPLGCVASKPATIPALWSDAHTRAYASELKASIAVSHAHHIPFRLDEMNAVSCGGQRGVSNTFAAGLWALDALFELASVGADGVNVHTREGTANQLFSFERTGFGWVGSVTPEYYGLLAFARAAPAGSSLLDVGGASAGPVHVWATRAPNGAERVVLINLSTSAGQNVLVRASGPAVATLARLSAPHANATTGITLAGQSFATPTGSGIPTGALRTTPIRDAHAGYNVWMPPASAAILTLKSQ